MSTYSAKHKAFYERNKERLKEKMRARYQAKKEEYIAHNKAYYASHSEKSKAAYKAWRSIPENRAKELARCKAWREANRDRKNATRAAWMRANPDLVNKSALRRRAALMQAIPAWADMNRIAEFYIKAAELTAETGERYNVDHIVPIQGRIVCGLHVENNLQILSKRENISKGNRHWPEMP